MARSGSDALATRRARDGPPRRRGTIFLVQRHHRDATERSEREWHQLTVEKRIIDEVRTDAVTIRWGVDGGYAGLCFAIYWRTGTTAKVPTRSLYGIFEAEEVMTFCTTSVGGGNVAFSVG